MEVFVGSFVINFVGSDVFVNFVIIFFYRVFVKNIKVFGWFDWFLEIFGKFVIILRVIVGLVCNVGCWIVFGNV